MLGKFYQEFEIQARFLPKFKKKQIAFKGHDVSWHDQLGFSLESCRGHGTC